MIRLGSSGNFGSQDPKIPLTFEYEKSRSGADMQYRVKISVGTITGASYFGYSIYCSISMNGSHKTDVTLKSNRPSQWSSPITYVSPWYTISGKTTGTTSVSFAFSSNASGRNQTFTYNMAVDPAASVFSAGNGTLGSGQTISVKKYDSGFTSTVTYSCGSASGTIVSKSTSTSISWTPPLSLASQNTTGTSLNCTLDFRTYSGSSLVGSSSKRITLYIPGSVKPSASVSVSDPTGLSDIYGGYILGKSKFAVSASGSGSYGSLIEGYSITANGSTYNKASATTGYVRYSGSNTISAVVTDSRGRTASTSKSVNVISYDKPSIVQFEAYRCNSSGVAEASGAYLKVIFSSSGSSINSKNTVSYSIEYKKKTETVWSAPVVLTAYANNFEVNNGSYIFAADVGSTYDIRITAKDKFENISRTTDGPATSKLISLYDEGKGLAIGKPAELPALLDIGWETNFNKGFTGGAIGVKVPNDNLDLCYESGVYWYGINTVGAPTNYGHVVVTVSHGYKHTNIDNGIVQVAYSTDVEVYWRIKDGNFAWTGWQKVLTYDQSSLDIGIVKNGSIYRSGSRSSWVEGRNYALLKIIDTISSTSYSPIMSVKSEKGSWDIGTYSNDTFHISYITDSNFNANNNTRTAAFTFSPNGSILLDQKVLYSGDGLFMHGSQTIYLSDHVTNQTNGIVLVFSSYTNGLPNNYDWCYKFIPKDHVIRREGRGISVGPLVEGDISNIGNKYLYIFNDKISGYVKNDKDGTFAGMTVKNSFWVLRGVIGV